MEKLQSLFRNACIGVVATAATVPAFAAVDTTAVETAINAAETQASGVGSVVIAAVAGLVVIGLVIGIVKKL